MVRMPSLYLVYFCFFFFFKQKTAYEMRISDWSSDVCSSDLHVDSENSFGGGQSLWRANWSAQGDPFAHVAANASGRSAARTMTRGPAWQREIGRASCRERVCQYV